MIRKNKNLRLKLLILPLGLLVALKAHQGYGKDFGKMANTFEIKEEGFALMMQRKLQAIDIEKENEKMTRIAKARVENPKPVSSIKKAEEERTFYFDPTYTLLEDIMLPNGQVLHKAGTRLNPLDHMKLNRRMFFIDGRDEEQVTWLKENLDQYEGKVRKSNEVEEKGEAVESRIILTGGKIFEIKKELGESRAVYFDQSGELTTRFGIKAVPAIAIEEGKKIRITEFDIEQKK